MEFKDKLALLTKLNKERSDQLERNKAVWIHEVKALYKNISDWFDEYIRNGYMFIDYAPLSSAECEEFFTETEIMYLHLGGEYGPAVVFEPTGINIAGASGKMDMYFMGHKEDGVFLLLMEDEPEKFHWEIRTHRKQKTDILKFDKESFEKILNDWLEKWGNF